MKKQRQQFLDVLLRSCNPVLYRPVQFSDVLVMDILCSFSRVFGDFHLSTSEMFGFGSASEKPPWRAYDLIFTLVASLPPLIRFRQCMSQYLLLPTGHPHRHRQLANAMKYLVSLGPILSASCVAQAESKAREAEDAAGQIAAFKTMRTTVIIWLVANVLSSVYGYWWDVRIGWKLGRWPTPTSRDRSTRLVARTNMLDDSIPLPPSPQPTQWFPPLLRERLLFSLHLLY
ncbi:hypothetical protein M427DRAFT_435485 [Gonapodya prolifera JEL478]|uniref:EXS domain-containing protein n=1 Tax=Gonapodya prolifera (strain JEL478) TaxID=1344416 RepID=A0A139A4M1_GONPJ|nr:hypothetical protein M427DRAFT_435485 [Gonapodya prolifera JEL478]|eukprot:KXS11558.1 hypothetical protein M427DRAFT_435485 [Gonapodya prolifera JEL478]